MHRLLDTTDGRTRSPPWAQRPDHDALAELYAAPGPTDADLLRRIAADNAHAFEILYLRHRQDVLNFLRSRYTSLNDHAAEDVVGGTFLHIWEQRHGLRITGDVPDYLRSVARNVVVDNYRHRPANVHGGLCATVPSSLPSPDMAMEQRDLSGQIAAALASLAQSHRFALNLIRLGLSARQIAARVGCTENAARHVVQQARRKLAVALSRCGDSCAVAKGRPEKCPAGKDNLPCLKYLYSSHLRPA